MRFIVMHKVDAKMEAGAPPDQSIIQGMGALVGESLKSGVFTDGAGLLPSSTRVRLRFAGGQVAVSQGPFTGDTGPVASFAMIKCRSMDEAVQVGTQWGGLYGDGDVEIGVVVEAWDIGYVPKPEKIEFRRYLLLRKGDDGQRPAGLPALEQQLEKDGVLLKGERIAPTAKAARLPAGKGKRTWIDGPFAESKEMIAGFSILELPSRADAVAWADRYAAVLGPDNEVDVRPLE